MPAPASSVKAAAVSASNSVGGPRRAATRSIAGMTASIAVENRSRLIDAYFAERNESEITPQRAWEHVYRLLLWVDQTTGLGHCYESDKCQPGKRWYSRSLAFHDWVSNSLGTSPGDTAKRIDWLFMRAAEDLAAEALRNAASIAAKATAQLKQYEAKNSRALVRS